MYRGFPIAMFEYQMVLCHDSCWGFAWICTITSYNIALFCSPSKIGSSDSTEV